MRVCIPLLLLIPAFSAADESERGAKEKEFSAEAKKELKKFEGKWKLIKAVSVGKEGDLNEKEVYFAFKGTEMTILLGERVVETHSIAAIDGTTDPKCIDLLEKRKGRPDRALEGIYRFEGDTLRLAHELPGGNGKNRPTSFDKFVDRALVYTLKRAKD
jgi:uncharacterized protein (TIGR03067 family)